MGLQRVQHDLATEQWGREKIFFNIPRGGIWGGGDGDPGQKTHDLIYSRKFLLTYLRYYPTLRGPFNLEAHEPLPGLPTEGHSLTQCLLKSLNVLVLLGYMFPGRVTLPQGSKNWFCGDEKPFFLWVKHKENTQTDVPCSVSVELKGHCLGGGGAEQE